MVGGVRTFAPGTITNAKRAAEAIKMKGDSTYSEVVYYPESGGIMAIKREKQKRKVEEVEAANIMAAKGYKVILTKEGGGKVAYDGEIFSFTFEQCTPKKKNAARGVKDCLEHAKKFVEGRFPDVALIYDKYYVYHKKDIEDGINLYESFPGNKHRFKYIMVIDNKQNIHRHKHNSPP